MSIQAPASNEIQTISKEYSSSKGGVNYESLQCQHIKSICFGDRSYCLKCGVTKTVQAYKSSKFAYGVFFDPLCIRESQWRAKTGSGTIHDNELYLQTRNNVIDFMLEASSKLKFGFNTLHLAIAYVDDFMARNHVPEEQQLVYAASALMLASKTVELDMKIPFISKLKRYTRLENPTIEFKIAEQQLLKHFNWNLQFCTLVDHMETLLSLGVVFASDQIQQDNISELNSPQSQKSDSSTSSHLVSVSQLSEIKIYDICHRIEKDYLRVANLVVRELKFLGWSEKAKAIASILYLRKLCGIHPICPKWFSEMMTGKEDIVQLFEQFIICLDPILTNNQTTSSVSNGVSPTSPIPKVFSSPSDAQESRLRVPLAPCNLAQNPQSREEQHSDSSGWPSHDTEIGNPIISNSSQPVKGCSSHNGQPVLKFGSAVMQLGKQKK